MTTDFSREFDFAKSIVLSVSEIPLSYLKHEIITERKADNSIVTQADVKSEEFIRSHLSSNFPTYGFLGEEGKEELKDVFWIIDPIDGTTAFAHGLPEFVIVLALVVENKVVFSLLYNPITRNLYYAKKGQGAFKNSEQIHASKITHLNDAYISVNKGNFQKEMYEAYTNALAKKYTFRVAPSAGVECGYLSEGKIDVLIKFHQAIWDVAPECFLMQEAGAIITNEKGNPLELIFSKTAKHNFIAMAPGIYENEANKLYINDSEE